jgi:hypothetical protein
MPFREKPKRGKGETSAQDEISTKLNEEKPLKGVKLKKLQSFRGFASRYSIIAFRANNRRDS